MAICTEIATNQLLLIAELVQEQYQTFVKQAFR